MDTANIIELDFPRFRAQNLIKVDYSIDDDVALSECINEFPASRTFKIMFTFILFCLKGEGRVDFNGESCTICQGEVMFIHTGHIINGWQFQQGTVCRLLCLSDRIVRSSLGTSIDVWNRAFYIDELQTFQLEPWFEKFYTFIREKSFEPETPRKGTIMLSLVQAALLQFCDYLEKTARLTAAGDRDGTQGSLLFQRFLNLLENTEPKRQTVEYYSDKLFVSAKYLSVVCKMMSKRTASEWIRSYVDADVRFYLNRADMSIKEVAEKLGFENLSFFGKYVRTRFGYSPRDFRRRALEGDA